MTPAELHAELQRRGAAWRAEEFGRFDPARLAKLVLLPEWTTELAVRLSLVPRDELAGFLDALDDLGLVESRPLLTGDNAFWVRASRRAELGDHLRQAHGRRLEEVTQELVSLTKGLAELRDWHRAATAYRVDRSGGMLMDDVSGLVEAGALSEAAQLVATVRMLGEVLGDPLVGAARRARRRVDRATREAEDARFLRHYLSRANIEDALGDLLGEGPPGEVPLGEARGDNPSRWALHLLGSGGAGKTMVVRYLASGRYARDRGLPQIPVARVDFDHLDPRYPEDRPGEILLALAEELLGFGTGRDAESAHRRFVDAVTGLHEELTRGRRLSGRAAPLLDQVLETFARFVRMLPSPVVLVLDTCEELAKLYPPRAPAPAIDMTFDLLERLRERAPSIRVLLAGRRWLAMPSGAAEVAEASAGPRLLPRSYVRVVRTRGFTSREAADYLSERGVPERLRPAVLDRAADGDAFNPFDLAAYAEWTLSDPGLDPLRLRQATGDPYVEHRIIGRLADQGVTRALAVAAELGRFDRAQVRPTLLRMGLDPDQVFDGLAAQEWTRVTETGADARPWVVELDEQVRTRLLHVTSAAPDRFPLRPEQLGRDAASAIDGTPLLADVSTATVVAAVRLLPPEEAAEFWRRIEDRTVEEEAWPWAGQVAVRAAAEEMLRAGESGPTILAAILATQAASRVHTGTGGVAELWRDVGKHAPRHPDPATAGALADRALLGLAAAGAEVALGAALPGIVARGTAPAGSVVAAIDGWMQHGDWSLLRDEDLLAINGDFVTGLGPDGSLPVSGDQDDSARVWTDRRVVAAMSAQRALLAMHHGDPGAAERLAADAFSSAVPGSVRPALREIEDAGDAEASALHITLVATASAGDTPARAWADWRAPRRLDARCLLVRHLVTAGQREQQDLQAPWHASSVPIDDIDMERLIAWHVRVHNGGRPLDPYILDVLRLRDEYSSARCPSAWLHHQVRPLVVELAETWLAHDEPAKAAALLRDRVEAAVAAGDDPDTVEQCQLALIRICRHTRSLGLYPELTTLRASGTPLVRAEAWITLTLVTGAQPSSPEEAGSWYGWWQCQDRRSLSENRSPWEPPSVPEPGIPWRLTLSAREEYARYHGITLEDMAAPRPPGPLQATLPAPGPGGRGRALLARAETLALRLPYLARPMLEEAAPLLEEAHDPRSALQARILALLTRIRADGPRTRPPADVLAALPLDLIDPRHDSGWPERVAYLRGLLEDPDATSSALPELALDPVPSEHPDATDLAHERRRTFLMTVMSFVATRWTAVAVLLLLSVVPWLPVGENLPPVVRGLFGATPLGIAAALLLSSWDGRLLGGLSFVLDVAAPCLVTVEAVRPGAETAGEEMTVRFSSRRSVWNRRPGWTDVSGDRPGRDTYVTTWNGSTEELFGHDAPRAFRSAALVRLKLPASLDHLRWESRFLRDGARVFRGVSSPPLEETHRNWSADANTEYLGYFPTLTESVLDEAGKRSQHFLSFTGPVPGEAEDEPRPVLHVAGTVVTTSAGPRLRLTTEDGPGQSESPRSELLSQASLTPKARALIILQADPVDGPPTPLDEQRGGFAAMARELVDAGAGAVLVIPPLPDEAAGDAARLVRAMVSGHRRPPSPWRLLELQNALKTLIRNLGSGEEAAFDVILFLPTTPREDPRA
ncbi:hypothetical protein AB0395_37945 [Streptosporangium sp. NPDC051023]|uniref:hypothetical protein n=1 Tax=Streptosporangium sp. NPDC051023 TaxID=3155410 RepID=UPI003450DE08